ncbi:PAAR motif-containing protein [Pseudomonas amygdali pv. photiniae]|uniref:PAAR motif-containing protein n=2 Tax=Pseudomonas syringae group genomosp. 2 TaxID=251698 RepID=A0A0P9Y5A3_PSEA0|nr:MULTISPECIES: PAAR domain-containing protein [Pseudomonas syringae group genomosp. 2]KPX71905.1 PAAR motif-containing protein [Pseudomonas amygdali pv. photiniae]RMS49025.1 PAAR motif-containing protein [Pseudomonas amygdali pv. photiniae]RMS81862.1 PAAR motif-containing protein [Pseudomonas savastanoi]
MSFIVREGDLTTTGGFVLAASASEVIDLRRVARMGDPVWCPACGEIGFIAQGNPTYVDDLVAVATQSHEVACGCPPGSNRLTASQQDIQADMDAAVTISTERASTARLHAEQLTRSLRDGSYTPEVLRPR